MKNTTSEKMYALLLNLYPTFYKKKFGRDMLMVFKDLVSDTGSFHAWLSVVEELPVSLANEHLSALRGGEVKVKRNIVAVILGVISTIVLLTVFSILQTALIQSNIFIYGIGSSGYNTFGAWLAYMLSGVLVGVIAKKSQIIIALLAGITAWLLLVLVSFPDWPYYLGYAQHPRPLQIEMMYYYGLAGIAMFIFFALGGLIARIIKNKSK